MFSGAEVQLVRALFTLEQQKKEITAASLVRVLGFSQDKPDAELIDAAVSYWMAAFDTSHSGEETRAPFLLQIAFVYLCRHPEQPTAAVDEGLAGALGVEAEWKADGIPDWILGQTLKRKAAGVVSFWRGEAARLSQEGTTASSSLRDLMSEVTTSEEEFALYCRLRAMHLANVQARLLASGSTPITDARVEQQAEALADSLARSPLARLRQYVALPQKDLRDLFLREFRIVLRGEPLPARANPPAALAEADKLEMALAALRQTPELTDEQLAVLLGLRRPASARFWKLKARELLEQERQQQGKPGHQPPPESRRVEQTAALPPVSETQDALTRQAAHLVEEWMSARLLQVGSKQDRLRSLRMCHCTSRLLLAGDRAWIAKVELAPEIDSDGQLFVAWRGDQFAIVPLGDFVHSLAARLVLAWRQRGYQDAEFVSWSHPAIEQVLLPQIRAEAQPDDRVWIAAIRVAFQGVSEMACAVWLHHVTPEMIDIQVINTLPPVV